MSDVRAIAPEDQAVAGLAAALVSAFETKDINPDPDVWQLIADKQLEQILGPSTFGVLTRRRGTMIKWMRIILDER